MKKILNQNVLSFFDEYLAWVCDWIISSSISALNIAILLFWICKIVREHHFEFAFTPKIFTSSTSFEIALKTWFFMYSIRFQLYLLLLASIFANNIHSSTNWWEGGWCFNFYWFKLWFLILIYFHWF